MGLRSVLQRLFGSEEASAAPRLLDVAQLGLPERPDAPFFERLPEDLGIHLVSLEVMGKTLKVDTLAGSTLLFLPLRQALAELEGVPGMRVHRSWWVARDQLREVRREDGRIVLEMANGLVVPVARSRESELRRQGWL